MYQIMINETGYKTVNLKIDDIQYVIPIDEDNTDYQKYLAWIAEGNEPEVIDNTATEK